MRGIGRFFTHLLFPPVCRGCGERFDLFRENDPPVLCPACMQQWAGAKEARCARCGRAIRYCVCMPPLLNSSGAAAAVKLILYVPGRKTLAERLVLRCKDKNDRALFRFFAEDGCLRLWQVLGESACSKETCIAYMPRRPSAVTCTGHDQARQLAKALGQVLDLPVIDALRHRRGGVAQKEHNLQERERNAADAYVPTGYMDEVAGKTVILVDDILTSGATLRVGCLLLLAAGAKQVIPFTVAAVESDPEKETMDA